MGLLDFLPVVGQAVDAISTGISNRAQRKYATKMYERQRSDALTDQKMQNEYNSPAAQMERLKAGGLNPNLVYGGGATTTGATVRASSADGYRPEPLTKNTGQAIQNSLFNSYDLKMKQAQLDQLHEMTKVAQREQILKDAQTEATLASAGLTKFNTTLGQQTINNTLEGQKLKNEQLRTNINYTLSAQERQTMLANQSFQKGIQEILNLKASNAQTKEQTAQIQQQIKNLQTDNSLKNADLILKQNGIQPGDPMYMRIAAQYLKDPKSALKMLNDLGNPKNFMSHPNLNFNKK